MARGQGHRTRLLKVLAILEQETDAEHRLSVTQLTQRLDLDPNNLNARRNVKNDLRALKDAGYRIAFERHKAQEYYLDKGRLTKKELKVLVDLVQGARTIPQEMSDDMVASILALGSDYEADAIMSKIRVRNRIKLFNAELVDNIWTIKKAIDSRNKIGFRYFHYGFDFKPVYHSEGTEESPFLLFNKDGAYYVVTYSDNEKCIKHRRVDRMTDVAVLNKKRTWKPELQNYDLDVSTLFGMYSGEVKYVTLTVEEKAMNVLIDQFGRNMEISNIREVEKDGKVVRCADVKVKVAISPQFEGWLKGIEDIVTWNRD